MEKKIMAMLRSVKIKELLVPSLGTTKIGYLDE